MADQSLLKFKVPVGIALYKNYLYVVDAEENSVYQLNLTYVDEKTIQSTPIKSHPVALSQKNCVTCHLSWAKEKQLDSQKYKDEVLPVASFEMCYSCHHGVILDSRFMIKHGDQHPTIYDLEKDKLTLKEMNAREDKLPKEFPITKNKEMLCSSCHMPHNSDKGAQTLYVEHQNAWLRVSNKDGDLCERCHESKTKNARELDKKNRGINHPLAIKLKTPPKKGELGYATEKELQKGLPDELKKALASLSTQSQIICQSCHQIHGGKGNDLLAVTKDKGALCVQCHAKQNSKNKKDAHRKGIHPVNVKLEKPIKRKGEKIAKVTCDSCHKVHNGSLGTDLLPDYMKKSEDLCMDCHEHQHAKDEKEALKKGVHPTNEKLEKPVTIAGKKIHKLGCLSCHSIHDGKPNTPALVQEYKKDQLCKNCHKKYFAKDKKEALKKGIHPMNHKLEKAVKIAKKEVQQMGCLSCHVIHKDGIAETPALLEKYKNGEICKHCHENKRPIVGTDHDLRITAKNKKNHFDELPKESGVCGTCHTMHRGEGKQPHLFAANIVTNTVKKKDNNKNDQALFEEDKLCLNCHQQGGIAKKKTIKYFSHPYRDMILRSDEKIMPLLGKHGTIKEFGSIACITCHEPHLWQSLAVNKNPKPLLNKKNIEGTVKNSFLRRLGVVDTFCVDCHSLEALPKYKYYHDKDKVRNIGVDYLK